MRLMVKQLIGRPIISLEDGRPVASFGDFMVNPETGQIMGIITPKSLFKQAKLITANSIRQLSKEGIIINSGEDVGDIEDIVRVKEFLSNGHKVPGSQVVTLAGNKLGKVKDYEVDPERMLLTSIRTGTSFISKDNIVRITPGNILVKDASVASAEAVPAGKRAVGKAKPVTAR